MGTGGRRSPSRGPPASAARGPPSASLGPAARPAPWHAAAPPRGAPRAAPPPLLRGAAPRAAQRSEPRAPPAGPPRAPPRTESRGARGWKGAATAPRPAANSRRQPRRSSAPHRRLTAFIARGHREASARVPSPAVLLLHRVPAAPQLAQQCGQQRVQQGQPGGRAAQRSVRGTSAPPRTVPAVPPAAPPRHSPPVQPQPAPLLQLSRLPRRPERGLQAQTGGEEPPALRGIGGQRQLLRAVPAAGGCSPAA